MRCTTFGGILMLARINPAEWVLGEERKVNNLIAETARGPSGNILDVDAYLAAVGKAGALIVERAHGQIGFIRYMLRMALIIESV